MHVLSDTKRTVFWLIIGAELVGISAMVGLLVYKKFVIDRRNPAPKQMAQILSPAETVQTNPPALKDIAEPAKPSDFAMQSSPAEGPAPIEQPVADEKIQPAEPTVASPEPVEKIAPQPQPQTNAEPVVAAEPEINEQGDASAWQMYEKEAKSDNNNSNSAAFGPPLPKVIKNPRIVVTKSKGILEVFGGSKLLRTYKASTGSNAGDKEVSGDRKTPEGEFYVCVKNPKSRFVLSLGLSYPSYEDARRGLRDGLITQAEYSHIVSELNMKRQPPWNTKLGGEVMIHGVRQGGRATAGCIALENDDIRELYPRIPKGTKVIVKP